MPAAAPSTVTQRRVQVWLGADPIANWTGNPDLAARVEAAMRRWFPSLQVTNEPAVSRDLQDKDA
jgi:hypothetical protein